MKNYISRIVPKTLLLLFFLTVPAAAQAEPFETIINNGNPLNRVDIVVVGDGYTAGQIAQYRLDVQNFFAGVFAQEPYKEYQRYFNVHRIDVISMQSGADHPDRTPQVFVNTAFDATYNCGNIQRLICVNSTKVFNVVNSSTPSTAYRDVVVVIVNDPEYGGSGGGVSVASVHEAAVELVLHEVGHSFGLLADEYAGGGPSCNSSVEPSAPNATKQTSRNLIKWNHWIDASTPIPTLTTTPGVPGLYEGSQYCDTGLYRPTFDSKMRSLGPPFEQINTEQHVKRIYNFVSPIDSSSPAGGTVSITTAGIRQLSVTTPQPFTHTLGVTWFVDGVQRATGTTFNLDPATLTAGGHTVEARIVDSTPMVRSDPMQLLSENRTWNVNVQCFYGPSATILAFAANGGSSSINVSSPVGCSWNATSNDSWIIINSGSGGPGSGVVNFTLQSHSGLTRRIGSFSAGGQVVTVFQGAAYLDVPQGHLFYNDIGKLSARGITVGCGGGNFCPESPVTREQMAAFIIRSLGEFNPPAPTSQRYVDVPPSNSFYAFIEQMAVRGITVGCGGGNYCPVANVVREQMAAFLIRARGEFNPPTPASQRYGDVPPSNPFYNFIDRLAVLGITSGCGGGNFCPSNFVTRGQMSAFLVRAFGL
jgi:IgA peptidase M64/S-layer family protein